MYVFADPSQFITKTVELEPLGFPGTSSTRRYLYIYIKTSFYRITNPYDDLVVALIRNIEK